MPSKHLTSRPICRPREIPSSKLLNMFLDDSPFGSVNVYGLLFAIESSHCLELTRNHDLNCAIHRHGFNFLSSKSI